jgi:hypothetical protein
MKLFQRTTDKPRLELCERCATACDATCIAELERNRIFENMLRYGYRPL